MLRFQIALAAMLVAIGSIACAGDFVPRAAGNTLAAVADDPVARSASSAAMSEPDPAPVESVPATPAHATPLHRAAAQVGADEVVAERSSATSATDDDKSAPRTPARKAHALRWQSLLPGVMK